jgi:hypothetical protein
MNRLKNEQSPYLRHAADQKIDWYPWSDEAFEKALHEDKPVFLSSGAVWCHWCHVMAKECFENEGVAELLNEHFISIKLDRDERPDIDRRYQYAVSAMGFGGGWPLTVFLTPDKKPFFGGTYFPPEESLERPGFKKVLQSVAEFYQNKRDRIAEYSQKIMDSLKPKPLKGGAREKASVNEAVMKILTQFDMKNGGFGTAPKFPAPGTIELLINRHYFSHLESLLSVVNKMLKAMAEGGFHDQIGGGFHRYSVDEAWTIPHFEKMAEDNAWHLRNYSDAYHVSGNKYFKEVAEGISMFVSDVLADPGGGFYASQDADVTPDDEGGYFTWTDEEFKKALAPEEYPVLSLHLLNSKATMHHDRTKKALCISMHPEEIAKKLDMDIVQVSEIIRQGKKKLLRERNKRRAPFTDKTLYTSTNGMMIAAYLKAFRTLKSPPLKDFALKSLRRIMKDHYRGNELFHTPGVKALLDDYVCFIEALVAAYEITGDSAFLSDADQLMQACIRKFWDKESGGFFDTADEVLGVRLKGIEDIPHPSANGIGIILLLKLSAMTGKKHYQDYAETALKAFSILTKDMVIHSGYYFCALDASFQMLRLTLPGSPGNELSSAALSSFRPYVSISYGDDRGHIIPCIQDVCYEPLTSPDDLRDFLSRH